MVNSTRPLAATVREHDVQLGGLIRNNPLAIVVIDAEQLVQMCNPAFESCSATARPRSSASKIASAAGAGETRRRSRTGSAGRGLGGETASPSPRRRKDGSLVDVEVTFVPFTADDGRRGAYAYLPRSLRAARAERHLRAQYAVIEALANSSTIEDAAEWVLARRRRVGGLAGRRDVARRQDVRPDALRRLLVS